jgi:hypothetical protein
MFNLGTSRYFSPSTAQTLAYAGSFGINTTTGNQSITGMGFQPKVVLFKYNRRIVDGSAGEAIFGFGVAISSSSRRAVGAYSQNGLTASANNIWNRNDRCIYIGGNTISADFVSHDNDGFTINVTSNTVAESMAVSYLALGGDALTDVYLGTGANRTTAGTQDYTGVGFQPTALITFSGKFTTEPLDSTTSGNAFLGFATSSTERGFVAWRTVNNANPNQTLHAQSTQKVVGFTSNMSLGADFDSFLSDGFRLSYPGSGAASTDMFYYLALKGAQFKVGAFNQPTSTGVQQVTGMGFTPKALVVLSANDVSANNDASNNDAKVSLGWGTSATERGTMYAGDLHNVSPTQAHRDLDRTKILKLFSPGTPTLNAAADLDGFISGGAELDWTTVDATARQVLYLAIG